MRHAMSCRVCTDNCQQWSVPSMYTANCTQQMLVAVQRTSSHKPANSHEVWRNQHHDSTLPSTLFQCKGIGFAQPQNQQDQWALQVLVFQIASLTMYMLLETSTTRAEAQCRVDFCVK
eukprot:6431527-Amphidinium_carterae.2